MKLNDTITAIATPRGSGGVAIIRISGACAEQIADNIVVPYGGKAIFDLESHKLTLCKICNKGSVIDQALVAVMRAPKSYTGETVVEINCHGGYLVADKILKLLMENGARLAEAGEFTQRAFINGKTSLCQAEAVMDLMNSASEAGLHNSALSLTGALGEKISALRGRVLDLAGHISATADYPDEVDPPEPQELIADLENVADEIDTLLKGFETGRVMRDGVRTAIVGRPNVGKSSVLNAIMGCERAIVTDIPGTTRDTIEEVVSLGGIALRLIDTAGIRTASDMVEEIGIRRSRENIRTADLCLFILDSSRPISGEDVEIARAIGDKKTIVILNKTDKPSMTDPKKVVEVLGIDAQGVIETSVEVYDKATGIDILEEKISQMFVGGGIQSDRVYIANQRQCDALLKARDAISSAVNGFNFGLPYDLLYIDLENALSALGEITGETVQEEIVDSVFERFCVGK